MAADLVASVVRIEEMSKRLWVMVPQSPGVAVAMWIFQPDSARRMRVPPQRISASSGWARKERAVGMDGVGLYSVIERGWRTWQRQRSTSNSQRPTSKVQREHRT